MFCIRIARCSDLFERFAGLKISRFIKATTTMIFGFWKRVQAGLVDGCGFFVQNYPLPFVHFEEVLIITLMRFSTATCIKVLKMQRNIFNK